MEERATTVKIPRQFTAASRIDLLPISSLVLRCSIGIVFFSHGLPKLQHEPQWAHAFVQMGFPGFFAYIAGALETVGGLALIVGLLTRSAAWLLAIEMAIAFLRVDLRSGPLRQVSNYELSMILAAAAFAVAIFGPGRFSVDALVGRKKKLSANVGNRF